MHAKLSDDGGFEGGVHTNASQEHKTAPDRDERHPRVLVVDDNSLTRMVLVAMLERHGCHVESAENGLEAVHHADQQSFDVVFMDIQMPQMDGLEASRTIRRASKCSARAKIVAVTSLSHESAKSDCIEAGMNDFLQKPVGEALVLKALESDQTP